MRNWVSRHETTFAIIASTITIIAVLVGAMWTVQADYNKKFIEQQESFYKQINSQQEYFHKQINSQQESFYKQINSQQESFYKQINNQQKQFNETIEKIAEVEKQSLVRDHNLEVAFAKAKQE